MSSIFYNKQQIYSSDEMSTVILLCSRKTATSDIEIAFTSEGTITYCDFTTAVHKGQKATLRCADKFFEADVTCKFVGETGGEPDLEKLATPVIYIERDGGTGTTNTTAILGKAILGKAILGNRISLPRLGTPVIYLTDETTIKLEAPVIRLEIVEDSGEEPEILKLEVPVIRLEIVEDSGEEPDTPTEPIKLNTPVIYLETVSDGGEEPSEPDIPEVPEIIKLEAPVIRLEFEQEPEEPEIIKLDAPEIYLESEGDEEDPTQTKLEAPAIELITVEEQEPSLTKLDAPIIELAVIEDSTEEEETAIISGKWVLHRSLAMPEWEEGVIQWVNFTSNEISFNGINWWSNEYVGLQYLQYSDTDGLVGTTVLYFEGSAVTNASYLVLDFGTEDQEVTLAFYEWIISNGLKWEALVVQLEGDILSWKAIPGAQQYQVRIENDNYYETADLQVNLKSICQRYFTEKTSVGIRVIPRTTGSLGSTGYITGVYSEYVSYTYTPS